jgi:hypothetical protein
VNNLEGLENMNANELLSKANKVDLQLPTGRYVGAFKEGKKVGFGTYY